MTPQTILLILTLVDSLATVLAELPEAKERYDRLSRKVRRMVEESRDPTAQEQAEITDEVMGLSASLQEAADDESSSGGGAREPLRRDDEDPRVGPTTAPLGLVDGGQGDAAGSD